MNNRCGNCGFINFNSASACKRCTAPCDSQPEFLGNEFFGSYPAESQPGYQTAPGYSQPVYAQPYFPMPIAPLPHTKKNSGTNALLWSLLGVAVVVAISIAVLWKFGNSASASSGWQEYKSQDDSFRVEMPVKPIERINSQMTPTAGELQTHVMMGNQRQGVYVIAYTDYPDDTVDISFDSAAQEAVENAGGTLVSKKSVSLDGYPGMEIEMVISPDRIRGGGRGICRIYWAAPRLYFVYIGAAESSDVYNTRTKFLDSFKLRKKQV
ncbi:MAG: hypothetical protein H0U54_12985 [Acidobacteria bacterium]|nr:hypothetical protein [Acidobacteriota bacterium]